MADDILANDNPVPDPSTPPMEKAEDATLTPEEALAPSPAEEEMVEAPAEEEVVEAFAEEEVVEASAEEVVEEDAHVEEVPDDEEAPADVVEGPEVAEEEPRKKHWYVVKVQSGREDTIKEAIYRRGKKEGLEEYFGQIVIPVEKISEVKQDKQGRKVTRQKERKLYPGYLMVEVEYNDRILYLFRETSGVGDFVGAHPGQPQRAPTPMGDKEIQRMLGTPVLDDKDVKAAPPRPKWTDPGERVRILDGPFNGMDGMIRQVDEAAGKLQVEVTIFGRPVIVDFEYYQVEQA